MKTLKIILSIAALFIVRVSSAQEISRDLKPFDKIIASPKVNVILRQGDKEEIKLTYHNVTPDKINVRVSANTLRIYLDDARVKEKMQYFGPHQKESIYRDASITAYVTYRNLKHLEIRGNQELTCHDPLKAEKFTLKAYGENEINLSSVKADYFVTSLYGENQLKIKGGKANFQKYRLYGDNKIDTRDLLSYTTTANIYGESKLKLSAQDELRVNSFGEGEISYNGNASVSKGVVLGQTQIRKLD